MIVLASANLARAKLGASEHIGSRSRRPDLMETITCGYMAWALAGLLVDAFTTWWWVDSVVALLIVPLVIREPGEAISGEACCENLKGKA
jgi:divalent metal cation (Fe/Co/Zn/Cd) transporter